METTNDVLVHYSGKAVPRLYTLSRKTHTYVTINFSYKGCILLYSVNYSKSKRATFNYSLISQRDVFIVVAIIFLGVCHQV